MGASKIFSKFAKLLDRSTVDLPAINTPLADALAAKAASSDLADVATSGAYADLSGTPASVSTVAELTDATSYDFPTLNTPVANALTGKANSADLGSIATFEGDQNLRTTDPATFAAITGTTGTFGGDVTLSGSSLFRTLKLQTTGGALAGFGRASAFFTGTNADDIGFKAPPGKDLYLGSQDGALIIKGGNNVGIGTTSPMGKLHVSSGSAGTYTPTATTQFIIEDDQSTGITIANPAGSTGHLYFGSPSRQIGALISHSFGSAKMTIGTGYTGHEVSILSGNSVEAIRVNGDGNVGIGTTTPTEKLQISGAGSAVRAEVNVTDGNQAWYKLTNTEGSGGIYEDGNRLNFFQNSATRMAIDSTGNVGIGTTSPDKNLVVEGVSPEIAVNGYGTGVVLRFRTGGVTKATIETDTSGEMLFRAGGSTERMRIDDAGNVGIGTTSPSANLHTVGSATGTKFLGLFSQNGITPENSVTGSSVQNKMVSVQGDGGAFFMGRDVTNNIEFAMGTSAIGETFAGSLTNHTFSLRTNSANRLTVLNSGNVGIGTTTPAQKLDVVGNIKASGTVTAAGATFNGLVSQTGLGGSTYFGEGAGIADDLSANNNVGVGFEALKSNTTGSGNIASGYRSLTANTTGSYNTSSGYVSLFNNTTGSYNTASGFTSLYLNTTGEYNTANGAYSLSSNTTGERNTATGYTSLYKNTTGSNNTAFGYRAGRYITGGSTENTTSGSSLYLGADTKALANGDANEIVIGYNATGAGSNTATLGNESITKTVLRGDVETDGTVKTGSYVVLTLPPTPSTGMRAYVTDSNRAAHGHFGSAVIAAGVGETGHIVPVFYDGTNWIIA
jgi:hypothetical protein